MNKLQSFLKKNSSNILTITSAAGVIATAVLAVKATPKALELIEEEKESRKSTITTTVLYADNKPYTTEVVEEGPELSPLEVIKVAWKPYIPAIIMGASTIACIFSINILNAKTQKSLVSAYVMLDQSYKEYRKRCIEMYNIDSDIDIKRKIANSSFYKNIEVEEDKELFFDYQSMQWFESTLDDVKRAEKIVNEQLLIDGYVSLNNFYDLLGVPRVDYGNNMGWYALEINNVSDPKIKLDYEKTILDDGLECWIISMRQQPTLHLY